MVREEHPAQAGDGVMPHNVQMSMVELSRVANGWIVTPHRNWQNDNTVEWRECYVFNDWDKCAAFLKEVVVDSVTIGD